MVRTGKSIHSEMGWKRDHGYSLTKFNAIKRKPDENISYFIKRFNKLYNSFPVEIKPPPFGEKVVFSGAIEAYFSFKLRERRSPTLEQIQTDTLEIEANMTTTGKAKGKKPV